MAFQACETQRPNGLSRLRRARKPNGAAEVDHPQFIINGRH
jgi:hypothetical protein